MREIIKLSASVFVLLGGLVFAGSVILALGVLGGGEYVGSGFIPPFLAPAFGFGGVVAGASVVLIGGAAYLLASIDERLERALESSSRSASPTASSGKTSELDEMRLSLKS